MNIFGKSHGYPEAMIAVCAGGDNLAFAVCACTAGEIPHSFGLLAAKNLVLPESVADLDPSALTDWLIANYNRDLTPRREGLDPIAFDPGFAARVEASMP